MAYRNYYKEIITSVETEVVNVGTEWERECTFAHLTDGAKRELDPHGNANAYYTLDGRSQYDPWCEHEKRLIGEPEPNPEPINIESLRHSARVFAADPYHEPDDE